jgi:hypothetical protein
MVSLFLIAVTKPNLKLYLYENLGQSNNVNKCSKKSLKLTFIVAEALGLLSEDTKKIIDISTRISLLR